MLIEVIKDLIYFEGSIGRYQYIINDAKICSPTFYIALIFSILSLP